jgi:hypothetical protein
MEWQDRFRALGEELIAGTITSGVYRERLDEILDEADKADMAKRVHIPSSAAVESPTGEMTQIVGTHEVTTPVGNTISEKLYSEKTDS